MYHTRQCQSFKQTSVKPSLWHDILQSLQCLPISCHQEVPLDIRVHSGRGKSQGQCLVPKRALRVLLLRSWSLVAIIVILIIIATTSHDSIVDIVQTSLSCNGRCIERPGHINILLNACARSCLVYTGIISIIRRQSRALQGLGERRLVH